VSERFAPTTAEELREIVAAALGQRGAIEILGRGTRRGLGRPVAAALEVALERMSGITLYEPDELVLSAGAGTPLAEIEARLADNQQQLAFEPPDLGPLWGGAAGRGTIGGVVACNLSGPRRIKAGAARDHLLGAQVVTGRGEVMRAGGRVMKNVTGYDLCKLFAGSFGTLVAMTEVTLKVLPAAEESVTLVVAGPERGAGLRALRDSLGSAYDVAGAAWLPATTAEASSVAEIARADADLALIRIEGAGPSVRYRAERLTDLLAPAGGAIGELDHAASTILWREIRDVRLLPQGAPVLWRASVPPAAAPEVITLLEHAFDVLDWQADWGGGLLWLAMGGSEDGGAATLRRIIAACGGHATLIRGDAGLRGWIEVFQSQPPALARLSARVKASFDPERILNPGRLHPDL
jgi:glycolate oxidase FAD binding subunit